MSDAFTEKLQALLVFWCRKILQDKNGLRIGDHIVYNHEPAEFAYIY